jgi:hypothetical protein
MSYPSNKNIKKESLFELSEKLLTIEENLIKYEHTKGVISEDVYHLLDSLNDLISMATENQNNLDYLDINKLYRIVDSYELFTKVIIINDITDLVKKCYNF